MVKNTFNWLMNLSKNGANQLQDCGTNLYLNLFIWSNFSHWLCSRIWIPLCPNPDCRKQESWNSQSVCTDGSQHPLTDWTCVCVISRIDLGLTLARRRLFCILHATAARFYGTAKTTIASLVWRLCDQGPLLKNSVLSLSQAASAKQSAPEWYCRLNSAAQIIMWKVCWPRFGVARVPFRLCVTFA